MASKTCCCCLTIQVVPSFQRERWGTEGIGCYAMNGEWFCPKCASIPMLIFGLRVSMGRIESKLDALFKRLDEIEAKIDYAPGGPGAVEAEAHFNSLSSSTI